MESAPPPPSAPAPPTAAGSGVAAVKAMTTVLPTVYGVLSAEALAKPFDVVIVGGGPAGVAAAQKAAFLGRRALLVDDAPCAPTSIDATLGAPTGLFSKALRDTAKTLDVELLAKMGLNDEVVWAQVQASVGRLATNNARNMMGMLSELKIDYMRARAVLSAAAESSSVKCTARDGSAHSVTCSHVLLATGSTPTRPKEVPFDCDRDCQPVERACRSCVESEVW